MEHSQSMDLDPQHRRDLLALARESIEAALPSGDLVPCAQKAFAAPLLQHRSSFITLRARGELRGCCGTIDAPRPLAEDVWRNAWASAFGDPRFARLSAGEWPHIHLHISLLSRPEPLAASDEADLIAQLRPYVDGLILELGSSRATFLPAVWEQLRDAAMFVRELKIKAGWPPAFWSSQVRAWRYTTESFGE